MEVFTSFAARIFSRFTLKPFPSRQSWSVRCLEGVDRTILKDTHLSDLCTRVWRMQAH